jgi:GAF domain-containing protein
VTGAGTVEVARRLDELVASAAELVHVECVGLLLRDSADRLRTISTSGQSALDLEHAQQATGTGPGPDVQRAGHPVAVTDVLAVPAYAPLVPRVRGSGVRAVLGAPVVVGGTVIGNLNAVDPVPHGWTGRQQAAMAAFAGLVADLLLMSAAAHGEDVVTLTDRLADLDGAPA